MPENNQTHNLLHNHTLSECSLSTEYDDSLDRIRSFPATPTRKVGEILHQYGEGELEFEPIALSNSYHTTFQSNNAINLSQSSGLSEDDIKKLYRNARGDHSLTENDLKLYEKELFQSETNRTHNKGYISDAESVKTYQDSGIYDDDVFIESPKALSSDEFKRHMTNFNEKVQGENLDDVERYSAFKTPLSSRQNSLESLNSPECQDQAQLGIRITARINNNIHIIGKHPQAACKHTAGKVSIRFVSDILEDKRHFPKSITADMLKLGVLKYANFAKKPHDESFSSMIASLQPAALPQKKYVYPKKFLYRACEKFLLNSIIR